MGGRPVEAVDLYFRSRPVSLESTSFWQVDLCKTVSLSSVTQAFLLQSLHIIYGFEALNELFQIMYVYLFNLQICGSISKMGVKCNFG